MGRERLQLYGEPDVYRSVSPIWAMAALCEPPAATVTCVRGINLLPPVVPCRVQEGKRGGTGIMGMLFWALGRGKRHGVSLYLQWWMRSVWSML